PGFGCPDFDACNATHAVVRDPKLALHAVLAPDEDVVRVFELYRVAPGAFDGSQGDTTVRKRGDGSRRPIATTSNLERATAPCAHESAFAMRTDTRRPERWEVDGAAFFVVEANTALPHFDPLLETVDPSPFAEGSAAGRLCRRIGSRPDQRQETM